MLGNDIIFTFRGTKNKIDLSCYFDKNKDELILRDDAPEWLYVSGNNLVIKKNANLSRKHYPIYIAQKNGKKYKEKLINLVFREYGLEEKLKKDAKLDFTDRKKIMLKNIAISIFYFYKKNKKNNNFLQKTGLKKYDFEDFYSFFKSLGSEFIYYLSFEEEMKFISHIKPEKLKNHLARSFGFSHIYPVPVWQSMAMPTMSNLKDFNQISHIIYMAIDQYKQQLKKNENIKRMQDMPFDNNKPRS